MVDNNPKENNLLLGLHKPRGIICSHKDDKGRISIYDIIPKKIKKNISGKLHSIGRLDFNSQGLILLTTNTKIKHYLESPASKIIRVYKARIQGALDNKHFIEIKKGIIVKGISYKVSDIQFIKRTRTYTWCLIKLNEGKNQHIRKLFSKLGFTVNKLIRIQYGPFRLSSLEVGHVRTLKLNKIYNKNENSYRKV